VTALEQEAQALEGRLGARQERRERRLGRRTEILEVRVLGLVRQLLVVEDLLA
jgi:hypothetical protein